MARLASAPLILPFDPASLPQERRREYLLVLWRADIDPFVFVGTARRLGYALGGRWDCDAGMPVLVPTLTTLH
ncbi:hypothetical protein R69746_06180 [Paraburkholderia aspalathi]|uniref:hypothetical protein n=1 Tax=Paraburkholderia aspalathi TaxID=1324617 RepID=UPI00190D1866|nr:hypothetical protein [Paraburkholderia aspalathi]MBK3844353.1 hypothetical protein [Paraburkholderia aspalathi]CAE6823843.1 hypothetical protein R69746_06180 [Paraburkholderia aspalathi]